MIIRLHHMGLGIAVVTLLASMGATAQDTAKKDSTSNAPSASQPESASKDPKKKISLTDVTRVSTKEADRSAAHKAATAQSKKQDTGDSTDADVDSVTEFSPAPHDSDSTSKADSKLSRKSSKSRTHGEAYGGLDPTNSGNRQTGGAVGTTSKSGKTSVYVQSEKTNSTTAAPQ